MEPIERAARLECWRGPVSPEPLDGGITNTNFVVADGGGKYVVRVGEDIPVHQVMRFNELAASRAAHAAGISPKVVHSEPGALVLEYIDGTTLEPARIRERATLERIVPLVKSCHRDIPAHLRGPALMFWVFHVVRDYAHGLAAAGSVHAPKLPRLVGIAAELERAVGAVDIVFGHNDLLAANFIDDGRRLWLIDWDYAGFNSPLFDLGGLASNNELSPSDEKWLLETYFERPLDDDLECRYRAMKCASLLRETMWSMVSEIHSRLDFDFGAYTAENLARFERAWADFNHH